MAMEQAAAQSEKGRILTIFRVMFKIGCWRRLNSFFSLKTTGIWRLLWAGSVRCAWG